MLATSQTKDELDVKLQKIIQDNPEINQKIEEHGGYDNLKQRLVEIAIATNQQQNESKDSGWWYGIKELFGISEAEASSVARRGIGLLGSAEIGKNEAVVDGTPAFSRTPANPKDEAIKWLVEHMDGGMLLTTLIALTAPPINEFNVSNDFEKRKHDDSSNKPSTSKQQQKVSATFFMPSDPNDFEPDDDKKNKDKEQNSFDPSKEGNHDKIRRDVRYGKLYRDANNDKIWYSKEISGDRAHAGEHWKQFIKKGGELIHEADIDLTGKVIDKWKSRTGAVIKFKDTIGIK
ncbi:hypothetical protein [Candidatus Tisiphia endosymbiont of Ceraclea dissimilis]|uniref:hypothetical protein n=1 Tax=Candidatus Tisiphia endosymbiont of Ceraclea dissimilis TaxID=3077928 RepID=UPI003CCB488B